MAKTRTSCGWCSSVNHTPDHARCPVVIDHADGHGGRWYCYCAELRPELHRVI